MKSIKKYFLLAVMAIATVLVCGCQTVTKKLDTPTNLQYENDYILEWDSVLNATGYTVLIGKTTLNVTETKVDLNEYLTPGKNNVWVSATSTNTRLSTSDAAGIEVVYDPFESSALNKLLTSDIAAAFEDKKSDYENDELFSAFCNEQASSNVELISSFAKGVTLTTSQIAALNKVLILVQRQEVPTADSVFAVVDAIRDSELPHRSLAQMTFNALKSMSGNVYIDISVEESTGLDFDAVLSMILANESLTVDTLTVVYEYLDKALLDAETAIDNFNKSNNLQALVAALVDAFLGENRPTIDKFNTLTSYIKTALNAYVSTSSQVEVKVLPDVVNFVLTIIDPSLDMVHKSLIVLDQKEIQTIGSAIVAIVEKAGTLYSLIFSSSTIEPDVLGTSLREIVTNLTTIVNTISSAAAEVDFTKEITAISTAFGTLMNSQSVKVLIKATAIGTIVELTGKTEQEAETVYNQIMEIVSTIDFETGITEENISAVLEALGMTTADFAGKLLDIISSVAVQNIENPEAGLNLVSDLNALIDIMEELKDDKGDIYIVDIIALFEEDVQSFIYSLITEINDTWHFVSSDIETLETLLYAIIDKANDLVLELSDNILEKYVGNWEVSDEEPDTPLFSSVIITEHSIFLDGVRAKNVEYSGNDYYGYSMMIGTTDYYVCISGERLLVGSSSLLKDTEYRKKQSAPTIPWEEYNGTYTGSTSSGESFTVVIADQKITVNNVEFVVTAYDDYEGFTGTLNNVEWYVMPGYSEGQIIIMSGDYKTYAILTKSTGSDDPSIDLSILAEHLGTYTGTISSETFTVVITKDSIEFNGETVTITSVDFSDIYVVLADNTEWIVSLSYGNDEIMVMTSTYSAYGTLEIVK